VDALAFAFGFIALCVAFFGMAVPISRTRSQHRTQIHTCLEHIATETIPKLWLWLWQFAQTDSTNAIQ